MDIYIWLVEQEQDLLYLVEQAYGRNKMTQGIDEMYNDDEFTKEDHECGICGRLYHWSADDIAWEYEKSPFMPCGDKWEFLDRVVEGGAGKTGSPTEIEKVR